MRIFIFFLITPLVIYSQKQTSSRIPNSVYEKPSPPTFRFENLIANETEKQPVTSQINIVTNARQMIAILPNGFKISKPVTNESIRRTDEFGNIAFILTNKNLMAVSNVSQNWVVQELFAEIYPVYSIGNSYILVATEKKIYIFSKIFNSWKQIPIEAESILFMDSFDRTATVVTTKRILCFSDFDREFKEVSYSLLNERVSSVHVFNEKAVFVTTHKTLVFKSLMSEFELHPSF